MNRPSCYVARRVADCLSRGQNIPPPLFLETITVRLHVLTAVNTMIILFWHGTPYNLVQIYQLG
jgi:hypothetical protein